MLRLQKTTKIYTGGKERSVMYEIVCSKCGEVEKIPFEPKHNKPVYCGRCYKEMKDGIK